jgi:hypothetical protein
MLIKHLSKDSLPAFRVLSITEAREYDREAERFKPGQVTDEKGVPLWSLELLAVSDDVSTRSEIIKVRYASAKNPAEVLSQNDLVRLDDATVSTYKFYFDTFKVVSATEGADTTARQQTAGKQAQQGEK